jgi:putative transcriptional regulator
MTEADWAQFDAITDEEAYQNALDDTDNPPLSTERLSKMRRIPNAKKLRLQMNLTQQEFARQFQIALGTLRDWEQGVRMPDSTAIAYLRVIEKIPDEVRQALDEGNAQPARATSNTDHARTA